MPSSAPNQSTRPPHPPRRADARAGEERACGPGNDGTFRLALWHRAAGDEWAAFDALPPAVRRRIGAHAYDAWAANALLLWRHFRRLHGSDSRGERAMLRYIDHCERLERRAFSEAWQRRYGTRFPHDAAGVAVLRPAADAPPGPDAA